MNMSEKERKSVCVCATSILCIIMIIELPKECERNMNFFQPNAEIKNNDNLLHNYNENFDVESIYIT